ncbi:response regulator [Pyxidicoccus xibeiensis]|uniref:response regulator n=1 Tax=Pyxidicoccus xibeiensis TaxID=2906759 RepID=UPI0020A7E39C|nr:response regulator [Pyxidicoccus xibeiensis]MCP3142192.1 response regulator [Pyxidicoccus xibeiensis]
MKVLLVEDDASLREGMAEIIGELADVRAVGAEAEALATLAAERFDLVITDLRIGNHEQGGRSVLEAARRRQQAVAIVSAAAPEEVARTLRPHEPDAVLVKPFQLDDIVGLGERFLALRKEVERLATARVLPPEAAWTELSAGVRVASTGPESEAAPRWVRLAPGSGFAWRVHGQGREGVLLVEGGVEVQGERHIAPCYLFIGAGPAPEVRTREGCLAVTLPLKG